MLKGLRVPPSFKKPTLRELFSERCTLILHHHGGGLACDCVARGVNGWKRKRLSSSPREVIIGILFVWRTVGALRTLSYDKSPMPRTAAASIEDRDTIASFVKGLEVIRSFSRHKPSMTLSEVAKVTDLSRAASRRFLLTLVREGYAETDGKHFRLRPTLMNLWQSAVSSVSLAEVAQPFLEGLATRLSETCFVAVLDGGEVRYVASAEAQRRVNVHVPIGGRAPAYAVSTGRVLLSSLDDAALRDYLQDVTFERITPNTVTSKAKLKTALDEARADGYALVDQELEVGLRSLSVPISSRRGDVIGALNLCCPTARITLEQMRGSLLQDLRETATKITAALPTGV